MPTSPPSDPGRPLIGLSTYREQARWGVWDTMADLLPSVYANAVENAGGVPVLLPPLTAGDAAHTAGAAASVAARLDGLLVAGGADVDPGRYGQAPHPRTAGWREDRDAWELALLDAADAVALPTLGVCRGMQLMAVHAGGTLDQHTPEVVGHDDHRPDGGVYGPSRVELVAGSRLAGLVGDRLSVHCHHHQSVRDHPGFVPAAYAADHLLEAMEAPGDRFRVGVQWHPEMTHDAGLFVALVEAAAKYRAQR